MERLTSSPYIVSMYAYCGNSVITEFVGERLDGVIHKITEDRVRSEHDYKLLSNITSKIRGTEHQRLLLAHDVAKSVNALHTIEGGPIVHADIQSKQFLVNAQGQILLNDFNRCRFMTLNVSSGHPCSLRIPSAPGSSRSPEEYNKLNLTEKLDVYSLGHVLYEILTGIKPVEKLGTMLVKRSVMEGVAPKVPEIFRQNRSMDFALANLIDRAYIFDPENRISSKVLMEEIGKLLKEGT